MSVNTKRGGSSAATTVGVNLHLFITVNGVRRCSNHNVIRCRIYLRCLELQRDLLTYFSTDVI